MPTFFPARRRRSEDTEDDNNYDAELHQCRVLYDEIEDRYICAYCYDDFTHSQLHATYGGDILPRHIRRSNKTMKHLRYEDCLICGLSVARSFD